MRRLFTPRDRSLGWHLAVLMAVLAVPLLALTIIPTVIHIASERQRLAAVAQEAREDVLSLIDRDVSAKMAILRALATSRALDSGDFETFDSQARELVDEGGSFIVLRDRTGRQLVNTIVPKGTPAPNSRAPDASAQVIKSKHSFISDPFVEPFSPEPTIVLIVPVIRDGDVAYTVKVALSTTYFANMLRRRAPPSPYYAVLAGGNGTIIASSYRNEDFVGRILPGFNEITLSEGTWSGLNPLGEPVVRIHRRSSLSGWLIAVAAPRSALTAYENRSLALVVGLGAAVALVAVGGGLLLSRRMAQALRLLSVAARNIGEGGDVTTPASSLREVNEIAFALAQAAHGLNEHAAILERANDDLERRVDERTRELRAAGESYHSIVDTVKDAIVVLDSEGCIVFFNQGAEALFGYATVEVVGQSIGILMPESHRSTHEQYIKSHHPADRRSLVCLRRSVVGCRKDGTEITFDLAVSEWRDGNGALRFTGILHDVTERERQAAELKTAKDIAETARARAEAANEAKSQFLASMSHELRTPLNAISGFAQLLREPPDSAAHERRLRYAQNIVDASGHLQTILDEVLDLARVESGRMSLSCEPLDCLEILTEVNRTLEIAAKARGVMLTIDTSVNLPLVMADRVRLKQVLINLGNNAIKYNADAGWVLLRAYPADEDMVRFCVRDNGRGIPSEKHREMFTPFCRLGAELGKEEGTGIGLAIARKLVHAMQGEIGFSSAAGSGSIFWIDIPVADEPARVNTQASTEPSEDGASSQNKVLYIEDKDLNLELVRGIIESDDNLRFFEAQTVRDGVAKARSIKPDLVITDIHLPDGKGFDVLQQLRADEATASIPVIALTADAMPVNINNMTRAGFDRIVTKPFKIPEFMDLVHKTLNAA